MAGAAVLVAATGPALVVAERAGFAVVDLAPNSEQRFADVRIGYVRRMPGCPPSERFALAMAMFSELAAMVIEPAVDLGRAFAADVVVHTPLQPAGAVTATALGVPSVEHGFQLTGVGRTLHLMRPHLVEATARVGVADIADPTWLLDVCPPSMHPGGPHGNWLGYRPCGGGAVLTRDAVSTSGERPRVLVSVGTERGHGQLLEQVLDALTGRGWDLLVAGHVPSDLRLPADVVTHGWLPFDPVLRGCSALVHHGGAGSVLTSLALGAPQVVVSDEADHAFNAAALERRGAGRAAFLSSGGPEAVAEATREVLRDPRARSAAEAVATEMRGLPGPELVVPQVLESLVPPPRSR